MAYPLFGMPLPGDNAWGDSPLFTVGSSNPRNLVIQARDGVAVALYILDAAGACVGIIGDISQTSLGVPTGLTGAGFASYATGEWVQL